MKGKILITGGAGFIGSHTADALIHAGYQVRVLDSLEPQVHGPARQAPRYLHPAMEFVRGDVRDPVALEKALQNVQVVYHLAGLTAGVQSMYDIRRYLDTNVTGTAALWDVIVNNKLDVERVILASSRAVYGEGAYFCQCCQCRVGVSPRPEWQLERGEWEMKCPECGEQVDPVPTREDQPQQPLSIYAQSKLFQEKICQCVARTYGIALVVLRYFNVYGPRQSLSNPYTGIAPVFCSRVSEGKPIAIYEDGRSVRDFIHVKDVARANLLALTYSGEDSIVLNVGSGVKMTILDLAEAICAQMGAEPRLEFTGQYRTGDIRSCFADISTARETLGFEAAVDLDKGVSDLVNWVNGQEATSNRYEETVREFEQRGLMQNYVLVKPELP
jgi:dTDP-L-rhamnose 4-epimerase